MLAGTLLVDGIQMNPGCCEPTNRSSHLKALGPRSPFLLRQFAVYERPIERRRLSVLPATRLTGSAEAHAPLQRLAATVSTRKPKLAPQTSSRWLELPIKIGKWSVCWEMYPGEYCQLPDELDTSTRTTNLIVVVALTQLAV